MGGRAVDPVRVLLHEAIHAATTYAEATKPEFRKALNELLAHARDEATKMGVDPRSFYGLTETQEFLAEAFTNPDLQGLLSNIPAKNTSLFKTLWDQFKGLVSKFLGFDSKQATALDEVLTYGNAMAKETAAARTENYMRLAGVEGRVHENSVLATPNSGSQPTDFMQMLGQHERRYLAAAFSDGRIKAEVRAALDPKLRNALDSADQGPSLLVNTGIALALKGKLDISAEAQSSVKQLYELMRGMLQLPAPRVYAEQILKDLKNGEARQAGYDVQEKVLSTPALAVTRAMQRFVQPVVRSFAHDVDSRMRSAGVPALRELATLISQRTGEYRADGEKSFLRANIDQRGVFYNKLYDVLGDMDDAKKEAVRQALVNNVADPPKEIATQVKAIRGYLKDMHDYLGKAGVQMGKIDNYYPVVVGPEKIAKNKEAYYDLMRSPNFDEHIRAFYGDYVQRQIAQLDPKKDAVVIKQLTTQLNGIKHGPIDSLIDRMYMRATSGQFEGRIGAATFADGEHDPTFKAANTRSSDFVYKYGTPEQIAKFGEFQDDNLTRTLVHYTQRAVRRAEWTRLGMDGRVTELLKKAETENATPQQLQLGRDYVNQVMGSYGTDWHPALRRALEKVDGFFGTNLAQTDFRKFEHLQRVLITYQNLRLLPLALASSFIDPIGVMVRNGTPAGAWTAYKKAYSAIVADAKGRGDQNLLYNYATALGKVEHHAVNEMLLYTYGSNYDPTGKTSKLNAALFKYNGLELMTKFTRLAALSLGQDFIIKHSAGANDQSARYMKELGLTPSDVKVVNGTLLRNAKIDAALTRFVDESVVTPNPAQRPSWQNDPHFMLAAQYKGYLYSFWNTVMRRAAVELGAGNYNVLLPLLFYIPIQALGEMARDSVQGDIDAPSHDLRYYAGKGFSRSGLLGPHINIVQSAFGDVHTSHTPLNSLAGPTGQQLSNIYDAVSGKRSVGRTAEEALPGSTIYSQWNN
jgi:hypothetical protein